MSAQKTRLLSSLFVLVVVLAGCRTYQLPTSGEASNYRVDARLDTARLLPVALLIEPYKAALDEKMNTVIAQVARPLIKAKPESGLGNWMTDAIQQMTPTLTSQPVAATTLNYGGLRIPELPAGDLTLGKVYELMPFDNILVILDLSGTMTQRFFDHVAADGCWPMSKEVQFTLQDGKATQLTINGKPLVADQLYRIAMPDYIADGGGDCDFLIGLPQENTGKLIRDLLIQAARQQGAAGQPIDAEVTGRVWE
ncbi:MAG: nucleotide phosphoesterase [Bacteroidetes bacterium]|nr:MAG: nucleotide phosphoesterase [Bacteroidota bacterium]PTM08752.1 MAG: nucleotide phosphoesterase [Bacteroidota bacterium]